MLTDVVELEGLLESSDGLILKINILVEDVEGEADIVAQDLQDMLNNYMDQYESNDVVAQLRENLESVVYGR